MAISSGNKYVYGKGDVCLKLNPFDNYRMFTLYDDWTKEDRKPIDLSSGQKLYLVFKSKNKEIRIPEYDNIAYNVDKVNGQVLFKINQKNAIDALSMDNKKFYITRVYEIFDMSGEKVISSDEEVLYSGLFADENSNTAESYTAEIKRLADLLANRNEQIKKLQESNANLIKQNTELSESVVSLKEELESKNSRISELETKLNEYMSGNEYTGEVIDTNANYHTIISSKSYTEEEMQKMINLYNSNDILK